MITGNSRRTRRLTTATCVALAVPCALITPLTFAQQTSSPACAAPASALFDVLSVKPIEQSAGSFTVRSHPDSLTADGTLFHILEYAFNLHDFQISGGPGWLSTATWDIAIKLDQPPANWDTLSNDARNAIQHQRMVAALAQRFALQCHFESRQFPVYNLVLAKGGSKLTPTPADAATKGSFSVHGEDRSIHMQANGVAIALLADNLSQRLGRIVIDKTGLTGIYDFTLAYARDADVASSASAPDDSLGPTLFTALEEQLGIKIESAKGPVPVLVIDSISRPSEN